MKGIVGIKLGMTQDFDESGRRQAVTVVEAKAGTVVRVKTPETDGYFAIQVGFRECDPKKLNRPQAGHVRRHLQSKTGLRTMKEFRVEEGSEFKVGQAITVEQFSPGDLVDVQGKTVGKGFAGPIKRHHFSRGPMTHGSKSKREGGSIGMSATPARVLKGKKMAGHLGAKTATVQRIRVHRVDPEKGLLFLVGGIPGSRNGIVTVKGTAKPKT